MDEKRIIRHIQLVKEVTEQPDYAGVLDAAKSLL